MSSGESRVALTEEEREYVGELDAEYRRLFFCICRDVFGEFAGRVFDDAWQCVLVSVSEEILQGRWPLGMSRWEEKGRLRFLFRDARRYVMYGRTWDVEKAVVERSNRGSRSWEEVIDVCVGEAVDSVGEPFEWGMYLIRSAVCELPTLMRETIVDFISLVELGDLAEREDVVGLHALLAERAVLRGRERPSAVQTDNRLRKGRLKLWGLLRARGLVGGEAPRGYGRTGGCLRGGGEVRRRSKTRSRLWTKY